MTGLNGTIILILAVLFIMLLIAVYAWGKSSGKAVATQTSY